VGGIVYAGQLVLSAIRVQLGGGIPRGFVVCGRRRSDELFASEKNQGRLQLGRNKGGMSALWSNEGGFAVSCVLTTFVV